MKTLFFYTKLDCPLCDEAQSLIDLLQDDYSFKLEICDIHSNDTWLENYQIMIPVIKLNDKQLYREEIHFNRLEQFLKLNL